MVAAADDITWDDGPADGGDGLHDVVAGHYEVDLEQPLGAGGMAVVYAGRDMRTRRDVALKTLRPEYRTDPATRARFRREARTMAFLTHANVARVYDLYEDDEAPWVVLEHVPGCSLKEVVAGRGALGVNETLLILDQVAAALDHLHQRGLVHLDVKPQNLIQTPDCTIKLIDFGLAQRAGEPQETIGGAAFGTAAYLAPEQALGDPVDATTDVYALGCVVYELLTGRPPFEATGGAEAKDEVIRAHLEEDPRPPSSANHELPAWIDGIVLGALAKRPEDRYASCGFLARLVRGGLEDASGLADQDETERWIPPAVETEPVAPARSGGIGRAVGRAFYRTGGRLARHTGGLRRFVWRAAAAMAVANLVLAGLLYFDRGELPGLYTPRPTLATGGAARVMTEGLRLRAQPGREAAILGELPLGQAVEIRGAPVAFNRESWTPVRVERDGEDQRGYVLTDWIAPNAMTGRDHLDRLVDRLSELPGDAIDRLLGG